MRPPRPVGALAVALAFCLALAGLTWSAHAAGRRSLSLRISDGSVMVGTSVTLIGRLTHSPRKSLVVIERRSGSRWRPIAEVRTDARGRYTRRFTPASAGDTTWRARAPRTKKYRRAVSPLRRLRVSATPQNPKRPQPTQPTLSTQPAKPRDSTTAPNPSTTEPTTGPTPGLIVDRTAGPTVAVGRQFECDVRSDASLWCWGENGAGQLGLGDTTDRTTATRVPGKADWTSVVAGDEYACGLRVDGTAWCWGSNWAGQLGQGSATVTGGHADTPLQVGTDTWSYLGAGGDSVCGVDTDHELWCWGANWFDKLGEGKTFLPTKSSTPLRVGTASDWASVDTDGGTACGLTTSGKLWCWGENEDGQLGINSEDHQPTPQAVVGPSDWQSFAVGKYVTCGIRTSGQLWCWGDNYTGENGQGDSHFSSPNVEERWVPTRVGKDADWTAVSAGRTHICGVRAGKLFCWGASGYFLKDAPVLPSATSTGVPTVIAPMPAARYVDLPTQLTSVSPTTGWRIIDSDYDQTCAISTDKLYCWTLPAPASSTPSPSKHGTRAR